MKRPANLRPNQWHVAPPISAKAEQQMGHIPPVLRQILFNRGLIEPADVQAFLEGRYLPSTDPFLLADMDKAVARIQQAIANEEMIVVYGDFDADGVTSTVLLVQALRGLGLPRSQVVPYIPDRVDEGYGLNHEALAELKARGARLVVSVDCGIRSVAEVEQAQANGLDMIITDHHSLGQDLPPAQAIINPKRPDSQYPETALAGVGIAFKLAQALRLTLPQQAQFSDEDLLDLVAIGTVSDLAPLKGENRKLVLDGLAVLNQARRPGVAALAQVSGLKPGRMTAESIGFGLGPRINAAGRLAHAYTAAKLLSANNNIMANQLAQELNSLNKKRQQLTADLSALAEAMVDPDAFILIAADEGFLSGIVGLVASRLAERNYRPAIVIEKGETESRASCRSIPEFHITEALDETADLLVRHGGHAQAAGFTVANENLDPFTERITGIAERQLADQTLYPKISIDAEIPLTAVDWALHDSLAQLEPTGYANAAPIFLSRGVEVIHHRPVGREGSHLQLRVSSGGNGSNRILPAIAFGQGSWASMMPQYVDLVYTIGVNEWNGRRDLQLMVQDLRPAESVRP
jgi:single-stranded-DNA-specific exonuclease